MDELIPFHPGDEHQGELCLLHLISPAFIHLDELLLSSLVCVDLRYTV